jgi:tRNA U34 5-carboxymethylaminomethyl modifying enzyme MnmG/GidA
MKGTMYTVRLKNGTVGTIDNRSIDYQPLENFLGDRMTVQLHDENGNQIESDESELVEILEVVEA